MFVSHVKIWIIIISQMGLFQSDDYKFCDENFEELVYGVFFIWSPWLF